MSCSFSLCSKSACVGLLESIRNPTQSLQCAASSAPGAQREGLASEKGELPELQHEQQPLRRSSWPAMASSQRKNPQISQGSAFQKLQARPLAVT